MIWQIGEVTVTRIEESITPVSPSILLPTSSDDVIAAHASWLRPHFVAVHVESQGQHALITGDLAHHPVQFVAPAWHADPDTDPIQSTATRRRILAEHADHDVLVIGTHFAPPCSGHLVPDGDGYRFSID